MVNKGFQVFKLFGDIGKGSFQHLFESMQHLLAARGDGQESDKLPKPMLLISSRGGGYEEAMEMYNFLATLPVAVITVCMGFVESAAILPYVAGAKRYSVLNANFMIHEGSVSLQNVPLGEVEVQAKRMRSAAVLRERTLCEATGRSPKTVARWMRNGASFTSVEAQKVGLVHEIVSADFFEKNRITMI